MMTTMASGDSSQGRTGTYFHFNHSHAVESPVHNRLAAETPPESAHAQDCAMAVSAPGSLRHQLLVESSAGRVYIQGGAAARQSLFSFFFHTLFFFQGCALRLLFRFFHLLLGRAPFSIFFLHQLLSNNACIPICLCCHRPLLCRRSGRQAWSHVAVL